MLAVRGDVSALTPRLALLLTLPPLLWAGNAVVGRLMVGQVPPLTLNFLRWALTAVLLLPLAWRVLLQWRDVQRRWPYLLAISVLGVGLFNALQYAALVTSTPLNITLVASSMPVWMLAVGALCFGERPTPRQLAGAAIGLAGVLLVIGRGSLTGLLAARPVVGDLLVLLAVVGWAFYSWLLVRPPAHMQGSRRPAWDWAAMLWIQVIFGLVAAGTFSVGEQWAGAVPIAWSASVVAALVFLALGPSIVAYRCWGLGLAEGGPQLAAVFGNLTPLFAALLSTLVLNVRPEPYHALAFVLIVAGIAVSGGRRAAP